ncbi:DUF4190 domain-containing protein [Demequina sp. NBRC 110056]|uniref:DUF4190 domain-containing protein n=1 Tax=Demequina sp. NBRC 110056 TaxID=1570345 RepID=UPI0009FF9E2E|nr:DUF4190 domain-containing protein [Demequina sp. NBRC 110056]
MTTQDPFQNTPSNNGWTPEQTPTTPEYQVNSYGAGDTAGYSTPASYDYAAPAPSTSPAQTTYATPTYPAYGAPAGGTSGSASGGTDGVSIGAFVTGLLGLGFVAVILGAFGLRRTANGERSGGWMAWTGVVLGVIGTAAWGIFAGVAIAGATAAIDAFDDLDTVVDSEATYGSDAYLDGLWDACEAGDDTACDDLYAESPFGSGYEAFGESCGGRGLPADQFWCEEGRTF